MTPTGTPTRTTPRPQPGRQQPGRQQPGRQEQGSRARQAPRSAPPRPPRPPRPRRPARPAGNSDRRLRAGLVVVLFVLSLFAGRLVQLQGLDAAALAAQATTERTVTRTLAAHRGDIVDVNGQVLATTVERKNVTIDQTIVKDYKRLVGDTRVAVGVEGAAQDLARVLDLPLAQVRTAITGTKRFAYVAKDISPELWREVAAMRVPGVYDEAAPRRIYPNDQIAASVVGFLGKDGSALAGVERAQDDLLSGTKGSVSYEQGEDGRQIPTAEASRTEPVAGTSVRLTIDRDIQWKAQTVLADQVRATKSEAGYVVVQNPKTGDILAMASMPTFDPNAAGSAADGSRENRALLDIFEPGSTSKLITASAAIEEGVVTPETQMVVDGSIRRGGRTFHDSHAHGKEQLTFAGALAQSSNVGAILAGEQVEPATMYEYMRKFGLGQSTGLGLAESKGILASPQDWSASQRYTVLFGQGLAVNAVQTADVYSTIANGGLRMPSRIVDATVAPDGTVTAGAHPDPVRVVSAETAHQVSRMLEAVVAEDGGTGKTAQIPGYRVAGKTGTSQAPDSTCGCYRGYTASFIGYAPADDPALVVSVVLQRPQGAHYGSLVSAPVFTQVMSYGLAKLGVAPTGAKSEPISLTWP